MTFVDEEENEVAEILRHYTAKTQKFVEANPLKKDDLNRIVMSRLAEGVSEATPPDLAKQFAMVVQRSDAVFPLLQQIYEKAGNDKKVNRAVGEELFRMGAWDMMQGAFYTLSNYCPLSIEGRRKGDLELSHWIYSSLQTDWNGIGPWRT